MTQRTINDLYPVLFDQTISGDTVIYQVEPRSDGQIGHVTTIFPVMLGPEFPKTMGHYHVPPHSETYTIKEGTGLIVIQAVDVTGAVTDFQTIPVTAGTVYTVPEGYGHLLVNLGASPLVAWDNWDEAWAQHDYEDVIKHQGFANYILKGTPVFTITPNSKYLKIKN
ncbi:MAG: hypothetical protein NT141_01430 [candidate division WWE3 bacterium]|nr:hypothetical protein [candidate division WWE3 bacterium]